MGLANRAKQNTKSLPLMMRLTVLLALAVLFAVAHSHLVTMDNFDTSLAEIEEDLSRELESAMPNGVTDDFDEADSDISVDVGQGSTDIEGRDAPQSRIVVDAEAEYRDAVDVEDADMEEGAVSSNAFLTAHNRYRAEFGVAPLKWNSKIADNAKRWATWLAKNNNCKMVHSAHRGETQACHTVTVGKKTKKVCSIAPASYNRKPSAMGYNLGENLAWSETSRAKPSFPLRSEDYMTSAWADEKAFYRYGKKSDTCTNRVAGKMTGHYTQLMWENIDAVGCGYAHCAQSEVWVCQYGKKDAWTGGNVKGQYPWAISNWEKYQKSAVLAGGRLPACSYVKGADKGATGGTTQANTDEPAQKANPRGANGDNMVESCEGNKVVLTKKKFCKLVAGCDRVQQRVAFECINNNGRSIRTVTLARQRGDFEYTAKTCESCRLDVPPKASDLKKDKLDDVPLPASPHSKAVLKAAKYAFDRLNKDKKKCGAPTCASHTIKLARQQVTEGVLYMMELALHGCGTKSTPETYHLSVRHRVQKRWFLPGRNVYGLLRVSPSPCKYRQLAATMDIVEAANNVDSLVEDRTWEAEINDGNFGRTLESYGLGDTPVDIKDVDPEDIVSHSEEDLETMAEPPASYDFPTKEPTCKATKQILDQGGCGSCYAQAAATVFGARLFAATDKKRNVNMSAQDMKDCTGGCSGGSAYTVYKKMQTVAMPEEACDPEKKEVDTCGPVCKDGVSWKTVAPKWLQVKEVRQSNGKKRTLSNAEREKIIKNQIVLGGPVTVSYNVYDDFMTYKSGIYTHKTGSKRGGHAVSLVGWGVDNKVKYWKAQNSWGSAWGEKGYFRIKRGVNECDFEARGLYYPEVNTKPVGGKVCTNTCANGGEVDKDCKCKCTGHWSGKDCKTCGARSDAKKTKCLNGGTFSWPQCGCTCKTGFKNGPKGLCEITIASVTGPYSPPCYPKASHKSEAETSLLDVDDDDAVVQLDSEEEADLDLDERDLLGVGNTQPISIVWKGIKHTKGSRCVIRTSLTSKTALAAVYLCGSEKKWTKAAPHCTNDNGSVTFSKSQMMALPIAKRTSSQTYYVTCESYLGQNEFGASRNWGPMDGATNIGTVKIATKSSKCK